MQSGEIRCTLSRLDSSLSLEDQVSHSDPLPQHRINLLTIRVSLIASRALELSTTTDTTQLPLAVLKLFVASQVHSPLFASLQQNAQSKLRRRVGTVTPTVDRASHHLSRTPTTMPSRIEFRCRTSNRSFNLRQITRSDCCTHNNTRTEIETLQNLSLVTRRQCRTNNANLPHRYDSVRSNGLGCIDQNQE